MILQAPILSILLISALASLTVLLTARFALDVLRDWDLASGSAAQLRLERRTHLVSTLFAFIMGFELLGLLLLVYNADRMAVMFVGAMCAVGTFNVNAYGFPALYAKIALFFVASLWLIVDRLDRQAPDYPLIRAKFALALVIAPLVLASFGLELAYFLNLETDVITSCCSKLFTPEKTGLAAEMASLSEGAALGLLAGGFVLILGAAAYGWQGQRGRRSYAVASLMLFGVALTAIVSVIALYIYEHPHHHCPFCLLKAEYGFIGYALYAPLFAATALGIAPGAILLMQGKRLPDTPESSLHARLPGFNRRLIRSSMALYAVFGVVVLVVIARSNLILFG